MTAEPENLADYRWLTSQEAKAPLAVAAAGDAGDVRLAERLREQLPASRARLVLELTELRRRAKSSGKFAQAEKMFFTRTDEPINLSAITNPAL